MIISRSFSEKNAYFFEKTLTFLAFCLQNVYVFVEEAGCVCLQNVYICVGGSKMFFLTIFVRASLDVQNL